MAKRRFYLILSIVTIISLFSFAAICTQCGADTGDKVGIEDGKVSEDTEDEEVASDDKETEDEDNAETEDETAREEDEESEDTEDEADSQEDTDIEDDEDLDAEEPTISLEIYEGPFPADSLCVYRVKANVTGSPGPSITWSKDDSGGSWGTKKAQVNLSNPGDSYTLTATATNSEGSATGSIDISWGGEEPEPEPEPETGPEVHETFIVATPDISGYIVEGGSIWPGSEVRMGDTSEDKYQKGYLSFNISELHGKTIQEAYINFASIRYHGDPSSFASEIVVKVFNYVRLDATDFRVGGTYLASIPLSNTSATIAGTTLKNELQDVLDNEVRDYFQIKLGLNGETDDDRFPDVSQISCDDAILYISYTDQ